LQERCRCKISPELYISLDSLPESNAAARDWFIAMSKSAKKSAAEVFVLESSVKKQGSTVLSKISAFFHIYQIL